MGFAGNVKVLLNTSLGEEFRQLIQRVMTKPTNGFAFDKDTGLSRECRLLVPRVISTQSPMITVRLVTGEEIDCTTDQQFFINDNSSPIDKFHNSVEAKRLKPGVELFGVPDRKYVVDSVSVVRTGEIAYGVSIPKYSNFALLSGLYAKA